MRARDIAYKETIQRAATGDRKYVRFFDGRGHFAHVRLHLIPRPTEFCVVTKSESLEIPESCYNAARASTFRRLESGPVHHYPMFGIEVQVIGGTYMPNYSYPRAFELAASMAFDEAVLRAGPLVMEPWIGVTLSVQPEAISEVLETLTALVGELPASISRTTHL
jgi:elongation factor G